MPEIITPAIAPDEPGFRQLKQVTVRNDAEIEAVNQLLTEGWRVISIGQRSDATVYVLGRIDAKQKTRTGFLQSD